MSVWNRSASCLLIMGNISLSWEGGEKIQFAAPQDKKFILGCCGFSLVCGFNVCLSFLQRENREGGGSEIQFTDKMESQHRCQEWKIVSIDKWKKFAVLGCDGSGRWVSVLATVLQLTCKALAGEILHLKIVYSETFFFGGGGGCLKILQHNRLEGIEE